MPSPDPPFIALMRSAMKLGFEHASWVASHHPPFVRAAAADTTVAYALRARRVGSEAQLAGTWWGACARSGAAGRANVAAGRRPGRGADGLFPSGAAEWAFPEATIGPVLRSGVSRRSGSADTVR